MFQASLFRQRLPLVFTLLFFTVGCDQVTKVVARDTLASTQALRFFGNILVLQRAENPGAFLNLGADLAPSMRLAIFTFSVTLFLLVTLIYLIRKREMDMWTTIALTLFIAGGIGNVIDRVAFGTVTDFLNLGIGSLRTGVFNFADVAIVAGAVLMTWASLPLRNRGKLGQPGARQID